MGDWDGGRETPALPVVLGGEDEPRFAEPGLGGEGMRQERLAGEAGPTSVPSFVLFQCFPTGGILCSLGGLLFFLFLGFPTCRTLEEGL